MPRSLVTQAAITLLSFSSMENYTGKLLTIVVVSVLLSGVAAWLTAYRYRRAMQRLMRAPAAQGNAAAAAPVIADLPAPRPVTLDDNRRTGVRLTFLLIGLSLLISLSSACIYLWLAFPGERIPPKRALTLALLYVWPVIPALGLMWRWTRWRLLGALLLWCALVYPVFLWRSIEPQPLQLLLGMALEVGPTMVLVAVLLMGSATRAVAPWLLLPIAALVGTSIAGMDLLFVMVEQHHPILMGMITWVPVYAAIALFAMLPWLLAWWPLRSLGRAMGRAYARKWLSDLLVTFTTVWAIALVARALNVASGTGFAALAMLLPLLWIPPVMLLYARWYKREGRPPTLLVLRVFQRDAQVQALFDHVIERWRLSGNTVMIAGTDLADRTLDADDIFTFFDRRLAQRFIRTPAELAPRMAAFDLAADADGRYRVNECYCHDATWQDALQALVRQSDVVLMDLRGFQAHNAGCRYELGTLAQSARALRVVVLADGQTDRAAAAASIGHEHSGRFVWLDATQIDARKRREVLASLFGS